MKKIKKYITKYKYVLLITILLIIVIPSTMIINNFMKEFEEGLDEETFRLRPENYFTDKDVIKFCYAAASGKTKKMDKLLAKGMDINTTGKTGFNPIDWFFLTQGESPKKRETFKLLLDHGAGIEKNIQGYTPVDIVSDVVGWQFAYELLKRGADYKGGQVDFLSGRIEQNSELMWSLEVSEYDPAGGFDAEPDYRQKVIEFLREKGVEVNPWMPEDEEYRYEDGVAQLYIKEKNGEWVKFEESSRYTPNDFDPDKQKPLE